ncbi:Na(+)/H(+) antiporter subunit B [Amycolatopsis jiangsuensis]|uniref:Putative MnhB-related membrane protein n=1 Tax=Amycolatopsis jiangsuensis TaxID=1181879 RepID=A0A840IRM3_9PSEU|nr:hydrogenase subunit MbhD domain-containing protein [Amycolatopsis jiangsuensis]MBB4684027.1 putative MnhB-related membrane protein [Amycolatopsis jiangsuensis]
MTTALLLVSLALVAVSGLVVVATGDPRRQAVPFSVFSLCLTVLFMVFQAPDVALSELAVGAAVLPLLVLLTVRRVGRR